MNQHFVEAEYFLVSYWPGTTPDDNVLTIKTDSMFTFCDIILLFINKHLININSF